jgi:hypothetical protein
MVKTSTLEIGTISFARCGPKMVLKPKEGVRLILAAVAEYKPDLLVTAGYAIHTHDHLHDLAKQYCRLPRVGLLVTEVHHDVAETEHRQPHAMWAITGDGLVQRFGEQVFAEAVDVRDASSDRLRRFRKRLPDRIAALGGLNVFALCCGEIHIVQGRQQPRFVCDASEQAILAADIVINPTHGRMSNAGTLHPKRVQLSEYSEDGRERVYVSCSNWEACGLNGRVQKPSLSLHTVYRSGEALSYDEVADGAFGFVYRRWSIRRP